MSRFLSERFAEIEPYTPGEQPQDFDYIKLNTNESPYPPSPKVLEAVNAEETAKLRLYSDPEVRQLTQEIAEFYGVRPTQVFVGNGSDEVLAFSFLAFCDADHPVCFPDITYGFYKVFAQLFCLDAQQIPLQEDFSVRVEDYCDCGRMVVLANPNAPTGLSLSTDQIERILQTNPDHIVLIDEAYVDFGGESCIPLLGRYPNLIVVQTFSKSRSLAGARLGFAVASEELIEDLNKMKFSFNPYNINRLSILAGTAAMNDRAYFEQCREEILSTRSKTKAALEQLGFQVLDSKTNFLFVRHPDLSGDDYTRQLRKKSILVRHFSQTRIKNYVRITIGTPKQMETLLEATKEILAIRRQEL